MLLGRLSVDSQNNHADFGVGPVRMHVGDTHCTT